MSQEMTKDRMVQELIEHHFKRFFLGTEAEFGSVKELFQLSFGRVLWNSISDLHNSSVEDMIHSMAAPDYSDEDILHIIDWLLVAVRNCEAWLSRKDELGRPKKLMKFSTVKDIVKEADKAMLKANQKLLGVRIVEGDEQLEMTLDDGCYVVRLLTPAALDRESAQMQHCIGHGGYDRRLQDDNYRFWSLRDRFGKPHATIEAKRDAHTSKFEAKQISGKQNRFPVEKYALSLGPFLATNDIKISKYEEKFGNRILGLDGVFYDKANLPENFVTVSDLRISCMSEPDGLKERVKLPLGLHVRGALTISNADLMENPINIRVDGNLIITSSDGIHISSSSQLGGDVNIAACGKTVIEPNVNIAGALSITKADIDSLPNGLRVLGGLKLSSTAITRLPDDIEFGGRLRLSKTPISNLPSNRTYYECLELDRTEIKEFPYKLLIEKELSLSNMEIAKGPRVIEKVGEKIDVRLVKVDIDVAPLTPNLQAHECTIAAFPDDYEVDGDFSIMNCNVTRMPEKLTANYVLLSGDLPNMPKEVKAHTLLALSKTPWHGLPEGTKYDVGGLHLDNIMMSTLHPDIKDDTKIIRFDAEEPMKRMTAAELRSLLEQANGAILLRNL